MEREEEIISKSRRGGLRRAAAAVFLGIAALLVAGTSVCAQEQKAAYTKVLLIGTDHRDDSWNGNSDTMILATIRPDMEKIILTSFMRDLYADIPGLGVHKLNYAYAAGGAEKLMETLEDNYGVPVDHYVVVDFESMADIVDAVGGVEITISDAECHWLNGYLVSMEATEDSLPGGGTYVLNGNEAVAYARIRFVGNNDYERTQRQRNILREIFGKLKNLGADQAAALVKNVMPEVEHDYSAMELLELLTELPEISGYELEEERIPYDGLYDSRNEMLVPDFEKTREKLHETIGID